mmetsp:Transcript_51136/g.130094  ORF Transcript_51136/g.130094 Transcript_51136/m.130094 type:complete len:805 (-) Transcript_51136:78-2492(-)
MARSCFEAPLKLCFSGNFVVPAEQPIELFFFQRVFKRLLEKKEHRDSLASSTRGQCEQPQEKEAEEYQAIPLVEFQRAMVRFFRLVQGVYDFDVMEYDVNKDGKIGWYEFCSVWRDRSVSLQFSLAERIFLTLEEADRSILGRFVSLLVFVAIFVSTGSFIVSTVPDWHSGCLLEHEAGFDPDCRPTPLPVFEDVDLFCVMFFTVEYGLRLVTSAFTRGEIIDREKLVQLLVADDAVRTPSWLRRVANFAFDRSNLVDACAILPWYLERISGAGRNNIFIQVIRLTRVVRAFRLGRRFEAVIIIMRSLERSLRALYVLLLNLLLGMIIFGALMYMAEQGDWDSVSQQYVREVGSEWNDVTHVWEPVMARSPFESIPACFWWAIVTATTVGYGDVFTPTTLWGKVVASIFMVWSLCVLALPIGVIGGNFEKVWEEYDREKREERVKWETEQASLLRSMAYTDPLYWGRRILFEVWHDTGFPLGGAVAGQGFQAQGREGFQVEFIGEVDCLLDLHPQEPVVRRRMRLPLCPNYQKAQREVRGQLTFEYSWQPLPTAEPGALLVGRLEVSVVKAEGVVGIDHRGSFGSDPYCVVITQPRSPDEAGRRSSEVQTTATEHNTTKPVWNAAFVFDVRWTQEGSRLGAEQAMMEAMMEQPVELVSTLKSHRSVFTNGSSISEAKTLRAAASELDMLPWRGEADAPVAPSLTAASTSLPHEVVRGQRERTASSAEVGELQEEVGRLKEALPSLQTDVTGLRRDMRRILQALQQRRLQGGLPDLPDRQIARGPPSDLGYPLQGGHCSTPASLS